MPLVAPVITATFCPETRKARNTGQCGRLLASAKRLPVSPLMFAPLGTIADHLG